MRLTAEKVVVEVDEVATLKLIGKAATIVVVWWLCGSCNPSSAANDNAGDPPRPILLLDSHQPTTGHG